MGEPEVVEIKSDSDVEHLIDVDRRREKERRMDKWQEPKKDLLRDRWGKRGDRRDTRDRLSGGRDRQHDRERDRERERGGRHRENDRDRRTDERKKESSDETDLDIEIPSDEESEEMIIERRRKEREQLLAKL